ncbi:MAG TPA: beta-ribofuranosylaminobenzene 5'-phosphate synthase family protein [Gemmatimonadaceae bacterium]|nr:beta-ribofuranosylaminobenzene 5'-phosphate synthase family protein [Gemmatimonadaceae bacterium]
MSAARDGGRRDAVLVEAPARLHFGMLDLRGSLGRRFGGIGAAVPAPSLLVEVAPAAEWDASGPDADRALTYARRWMAHEHIEGAARIRVHRALPAHAGLGSGTQLALAVARALAELHGTARDALSLARAVGRARRSAIGTWVFERGGFVLEGGRRCDGSDEPAPLLARLPFPASWRCVVAVPPGEPGVSGEREAAAFAELEPPPESEVERVSYLVLMGILPSLADGDLARFGRALTEVQRINGRWFAPVQGGLFAPGESESLVRRMQEWGAAGVGQSSWGPAVYGIVEGKGAARALAGRVRAAAPDAAVYEGGFAEAGALVRRAAAPAAP